MDLNENNVYNYTSIKLMPPLTMQLLHNIRHAFNCFFYNHYFVKSL